MNIRSKSLITQLTTLFLILSLISVGLMGTLAYLLARRSLRSSVDNQLNSVATLKEEEFNRWVRDQRQDVVLISRLPEVERWARTLLSEEPGSRSYQDAYEMLSQHLSTLLSYKSDLQEIFIMTDVGGQVIISTESLQEGEYHVTASYFTNGRLGTYIQNVYPSPVTGKPTMTIATPMIDEQGQVIGVMGVHLNLNRMNDIILQRAGLGPQGETYLVDRYNTFVSEALFGERSFPRGVETVGINAALAGEDGSAIYENYEGELVVGVYRWLEERDLALLAEVSEAYAIGIPARQLLANVLIAGVILAILMTLGVYSLMQRLTYPLQVITRKVEEISAGDLDQRVPVMSQDEVGTLANAFNQMLERLRALYRGLEERVAERTRELEQRSDELEAAAAVARAAAEIQDIDQLLDATVRLISQYFNFYHAGIFLLDEAGEYAVLQAASSEGGQRMLARGHKLQVGQVGIVGMAAGTREPRIALDVGEDPVYFNNPDLPNTRSEMALPLVVRGRVIGVLDVQSKKSGAFSDEDVSILQTMADQVALAITNARLFQESELAIRELRKRYGEQLRSAWEDRVSRHSFAYHYTGVRVSPASEELVSTLADTPVTQAQIVQDAEGNQTLMAPIVMRDQLLGTIVLHKEAGVDLWTAEDLALVETTCDQIALALDNARLLDDTQSRAYRERMVGEISSRVRASAVDIDAVLQTTIRELGQALGAMGTIRVGDVRLAEAHDGGNGHEEGDGYGEQ